MLYSVQIYNNCAILFQITYTLYIKPYVFYTSIYSLTWNGVYFTVSPRFFWPIFGAFVKGPAAKAAAGRYPKRAIHLVVYNI